VRRLLNPALGGRAGQARAARPAAAGRARVGLEYLEGRDLMAAFVLGANGVLTISGTNANDSATVRIDNRGTANPADDRLRVEMTHVGAPPDNAVFAASQVSRIVFDAGDGADTFVNATAKPSEANGGAGDDTLSGGSAGDVFRGGDGNDRLLGRAGIDKLYGEGNSDQLDGGANNDLLDGGFDGVVDDLRGGSGSDRFRQHRVFDASSGGFILLAENLVDFSAAQGDTRVFENHP
jgi:Ca2+-binding RTX toxin-like protein